MKRIIMLLCLFLSMAALHAQKIVVDKETRARVDKAIEKSLKENNARRSKSRDRDNSSSSNTYNASSANANRARVDAEERTKREAAEKVAKEVVAEKKRVDDEIFQQDKTVMSANMKGYKKTSPDGSNPLGLKGFSQDDQVKKIKTLTKNVTEQNETTQSARPQLPPPIKPNNRPLTPANKSKDNLEPKVYIADVMDQYANPKKIAKGIYQYSDKGLISYPIDKSFETTKEVMKEVIYQKAGYQRSVASDAIADKIIAEATNSAIKELKEDVSKKIFSEGYGNFIDPGFGVDESLKEAVSLKVKSISSYLGMRPRAIENSNWVRKNVDNTSSGTLNDIRSVVNGDISLDEYWKRWENRWQKFSFGAFQQVEKNF